MLSFLVIRTHNSNSLLVSGVLRYLDQLDRDGFIHLRLSGKSDWRRKSTALTRLSYQPSVVIFVTGGLFIYEPPQ